MMNKIKFSYNHLIGKKVKYRFVNYAVVFSPISEWYEGTLERIDDNGNLRIIGKNGGKLLFEPNLMTVRPIDMEENDDEQN